MAPPKRFTFYTTISSVIIKRICSNYVIIFSSLMKLFNYACVVFLITNSKRKRYACGCINHIATDLTTSKFARTFLCYTVSIFDACRYCLIHYLLFSYKAYSVIFATEDLELLTLSVLITFFGYSIF